MQFIVQKSLHMHYIVDLSNRFATIPELYVPPEKSAPEG